MKGKLIKEIKDFIICRFQGYYSFFGNGVKLHHDYSKYEVMSVFVDEFNNLVVEVIGYNSFKLSYFNADELSTQTLKMIYKNL